MAKQFLNRTLGFRSLSAFALVAAVCTMPLRADDTATKTANRDGVEVTGKLESIDGARVLTVWGKPHERGFAHGYLLAPDIVALLDGYLRETVTDTAEFEQRAQAFLRMMSLLPRYQDEVRGMLEGIQKRLGDTARISSLDRAITYDDLFTVACIPELSRLACSSFAAWGSLTGDGGTVCGRNLDWHGIKALHGTELIIAHLPDDSTRSRGWVSVTWPGFAGALTAMNDAGVCGSLHDVPALRPTMPFGFTPRAMALREALEAAGDDTAIEKFTAVFKKRIVLVGNNIPVAWPHKPDGGKPFAVIEYDGNLAMDRGVTVRQDEYPPADGEANRATMKRHSRKTMIDPPPRYSDKPAQRTETYSKQEFLICTNHYCLRAAPQSCDRYEKLQDQLVTCSQRGIPVDPSRAWELLRSVACDGSRLETHHSVVFEPNRRRLHVAFAKDGKPAPACKPVSFNVDALTARGLAKPAASP